MALWAQPCSFCLALSQSLLPPEGGRAPTPVTGSLVISAGLYPVAVSVSLGSPVAWAGFRMDAREGVGSYLSTVTEKGPFQYLCPTERSSGTSWGVATQGRDVSQGPIREQFKSEVKRRH